MTWLPVCPIDDILPDTGVCALLGDTEIAVFRIDDRIFALANVDPFSGAGVLSRGILGDRAGVLKVASPMYKQSFCLATGRCLDDDDVAVPAYRTRIRAGVVEVEAPAVAVASVAGRPTVSDMAPTSPLVAT